MTPHRFSGSGILYSFSGPSVNSNASALTSSVFGLVRLDEGSLILAQLTDITPTELRIGARMQMIVRKLESGDAILPALLAYMFRAVGPELEAGSATPCEPR